jgi:hypothetical protein
VVVADERETEVGGPGQTRARDPGCLRKGVDGVRELREPDRDSGFLGHEPTVLAGS